ncbi:nitroreductase family protein [Hydrogenophaga sp.]|uniref:nitroreductase family protein n=1 Tax=Hydrogenophaga sp. TaxID=1904254 RepID=UPI002FC7E506
MNTSMPTPAVKAVDIGARSRRDGSEIDGEFAEVLITSRQNVSPRRLVAPGPSSLQLAGILRAAAAAPDHGLLRPWRFVIVPEARRADLAEVFALALIDRDPGATLDQIESARDKAHSAPLLMLVVARLGQDEARIPSLERMVSVGCAVQNMLLMAHSLGLGSGLTSGQAMQSVRMRELFQLALGEEAVCFVNMGTVAKRKLPRLHPDPQDFLSAL